jgi:NADH-quinone oxidoreductase subunit C
MNRAEVVKDIKQKFGKKIKRFHDKSAKRIYIDIGKEDLLDFARFVFKDLGARFNTASAVDHPEEIEIMYHFNFDMLGLIVTFRTYTPKNKCEIESLLPIMSGAEWIEREIHELFGVEFKNHPNIKPLLLPDDWPKEKYPLRKEYKLSSKEDAAQCNIRRDLNGPKQRGQHES